MSAGLPFYAIERVLDDRMFMHVLCGLPLRSLFCSVHFLNCLDCLVSSFWKLFKLFSCLSPPPPGQC